MMDLFCFLSFFVFLFFFFFFASWVFQYVAKYFEYPRALIVVPKLFASYCLGVEVSLSLVAPKGFQVFDIAFLVKFSMIINPVLC